MQRWHPHRHFPYLKAKRFAETVRQPRGNHSKQVRFSHNLDSRVEVRGRDAKVSVQSIASKSGVNETSNFIAIEDSDVSCGRETAWRECASQHGVPFSGDAHVLFGIQEATASCAVGYTNLGPGGGFRPNTDTLPYRGTSAGGGYSTVTDLLRFADALQAHKLLNAKYTEMLTSGKVSIGEGTKYAFGFVDRRDALRSYGHNGGAPGMNGELDIYPRIGYVVAVLANQDPPAAERIGEFVRKRLPLK
ncbi:MAG TPA: serine hydrolase domain-containing protein [Bryobacteraceae bacterium]|nr:serine hydrolase domain-containing protein [Bryobacteraceae bacterium]